MADEFATYRAWAKRLSTSALLGFFGERFGGTFALTFDASIDDVFYAGQANLFDAPSFPVDALPYLGSERAIERYPSETDDSYKTRVQDAWVAWPQAGTSTGLLSQVTAGGFTAEIKETWDWDWDSAIDPTGANWSRFWLIISSTGWNRTHWGDGRKWGEGVWGADASIAEAHTLLRIIRKWKPGHVVAITIVVIDDVAWAAGQPDGSWGDAENRNPAALYHFDR